MSDLHLFTRRSRGQDCVGALAAELSAADGIVLNGDTFDFKWSTIRGRDAAVASALDWLRALSRRFSQAAVHVVLGNHDCLPGYRSGLETLSAEGRGIFVHAAVLRLGPALFLHGDCVETGRGHQGWTQYRQEWENDRRGGAFRAWCYAMLDRFGVTQYAQRRSFPRDRTLQRLMRYLDESQPGWRVLTRDCYFGHTHLPYSGVVHDGIRFHNTGSAIRGMEFNPLRFEYSGADLGRNNREWTPGDANADVNRSQGL